MMMVIVHVQFLVGEQLGTTSALDRGKVGLVLLIGLPVEAELRRNARPGDVVHGGAGHRFHVLLRIELVGVVEVVRATVVRRFKVVGFVRVAIAIAATAVVYRVLVLLVLRVVRVLLIAGGVLEDERRRRGRLPGWGLRRLLLLLQRW